MFVLDQGLVYQAQQWEDSDSETRSNGDLFRWFTSQSGAIVQGGEDRRLMDPTETENAHRLLGAPSCVSGSMDLSQGSLWSFSVTAAGQFHSSSLHKNLEATVLSALTSLIKTLGPWRDIFLTTQYIPKDVHCSSRSWIQIGEGQVGLDAGTQSVSGN